MTEKSSLETRSLVPGKPEFEVLKVRVSRQETPRALKARKRAVQGCPKCW